MLWKPAKLHSLHRRCGISPVFRCIWHNITAHKTFQTNISTASKETDACISVHSVHFSELTEVYLLAVCKALILNSMAVCRNTRLQVSPQSFLSLVLGPGFRQCPDKVGTTLLRAQTNPHHTLIAWLAADLDICHLTNKGIEFFCGVSQFTPILSTSGFPPVLTAHLEYSAAAKQLHFLLPWFTWDLSPEAILTSAGEELQEPETLTRLHYSPCLNSHRGHQREMLLLREETAFRGSCSRDI